MRLWITKNPNVAFILVPLFVPVNQSIEDIFLEAYERLEHTPEDVFCCLVIEDELIKAFVYAYCRYNDVFIWQARNQGLLRAMVDRVFEGLCLWARSKGFSRVVTIPNRAAKLWQRRWGFKVGPDSREIYKEI